MPRDETLRLATLFIDLEGVLARQLEAYRELAEIIEGTRDAIRVADMERVSACCEREHEAAQRLGELEKRRLALIGGITGALAPAAAAPLSLAQIAEAAPEPASGRLQALAAQLRDCVGELRRRSTVVRKAADSLSCHMTGILQVVYAAFSRAGVYSQKGRIDAGTQGRHAIDLKS